MGAFLDQAGEGHHRLTRNPHYQSCGYELPSAANLSKVCVMSCPFSISAHIPFAPELSYFTQGTISSSVCTFSSPLP